LLPHTTRPYFEFVFPFRSSSPHIPSYTKKGYVNPSIHPEKTPCPSPVYPAIHRSHDSHESRPKSSKPPSLSVHVGLSSYLPTYLPTFHLTGLHSELLSLLLSPDKVVSWQFCRLSIVYICSEVVFYIYLMSLLVFIMFLSTVFVESVSCVACCWGPCLFFSEFDAVSCIPGNEYVNVGTRCMYPGIYGPR
jgi:hypothetical protein